MKTSNAGVRLEIRKAAIQKYNSYGDEWERAYFDEYSDGFVVINKQRIIHSNTSKNEKAKFDKEFSMSKIFAKSGYKIELLEEIPRIPSPDARINGILADLKKISSHNNIVKEAKSAVYKQGAEIVLFEFENNTKKIHEELDKLKRMNIKAYYYFTENKGKIHIL